MRIRPRSSPVDRSARVVAPDADAETWAASDPRADVRGIKDCSYVFEFVTVGCDGPRANLLPKTDQLVVTIPRVCLGEPKWVRVAAQVTGYTKPDAEGPPILSSDFWAPRGVERKGFLPPFGPRVHHA